MEAVITTGTQSRAAGIRSGDSQYPSCPEGQNACTQISPATKPAEDRVADEFIPAGRLTRPCDNFFN